MHQRTDAARYDIARELQLFQSRAHPIAFHGYSMWPFLAEGDLLVVEPVAFEDVRIGDIVTFRRQDKFPTYRVVAKQEAALCLRGDNWPQVDAVATPDQVLTRAVERLRRGRRLSADSWRWRLLAWFHTRTFIMPHRFHIVRLVRRLLRFDPLTRENRSTP